MVAEILYDIRDLIQRLVESPAAKAVGVLFVGAIQQLFGPDLLPVHTAVIILVALDWLFGASYAWARTEWNSKQALRGLLKAALYAGIFVVTEQLTKVSVVGPFLAGGLAGLMVLTEATSVLENIDRWAQWKGVELSFLRPLICRLKQRKEEIIKGDG